MEDEEKKVEEREVDGEASPEPGETKAVTKTENGMEFTADAYLYVPDPQSPSTWKLRIEETPGNVTRAQLGRAAAALGPGFRGQRVDLPAEDRQKVARALIAWYRKLQTPDEEIPVYLWKIAGMNAPTPKALKVLSKDEGSVTIGGYAVVFGGEDLTGDYFTPETDFWLEKLKAAPVVLYEHGFDPALKKSVLGRVVKTVKDDIGLWVEAQLERHQAYLSAFIDAILGLCEKGVMGFSTGAVAHLVEREEGCIKSWPIVEVSLTTTPAEPRTLGVEQVKSLGIDLEEKADEEQPFEDETEETEPEAKSADEAHTKEVTNMEEKEVMDEAPALDEAAKSAEVKAVGYASQPTDEDKEVEAFKSYLHGIEVKLNTTSGGYFIPTRLANELVTEIAQASLFRKAGSRVIQLNGATDIPGFTGSAAAALVSEGGSITATDPTGFKASFRPYKFSKLAKVSVELANDAQFDLWGQILRVDFAQAFAKAENQYCTQGTGSSQPQGIKNATVGVTAASKSTVAADEIVDFVYSLDSPYRDGAVIMAHPTLVKAVAKLKDSSGQYLWTRRLDTNQPDTILGIPVYENSYLDALGTASGIAAVIFNPAYFYIGEIGQPEVQKLVELYAATGEIGYVAHRRFDSHMMLDAAFRALKLGTT